MADTENADTVLFIDDDEDFAGAITRVLEHNGYRVRRASNGNDGVRLATQERPDLILLDFMMPGKNGFDACHELRGDPDLQEVPIIALTAFGQDIGEIHGLREEEARGHVDDFLEKPVEPNVLLERMARALAP